MNDVLARALTDAGFTCHVEVRDRLAVIVPSGTWDGRLSAGDRARVVALARAHEFTHVSLDITAS